MSNDSAGNEEKGIWNGGQTNVTNKYDRMIRASEDYYDEVDSETTFREDLVKRERLMKEQEEKNPIRSKFGDYNASMDRKNQINQNMDKPCEVSTGEPRNRYRRPEGALVGEKK